MAKERETLKKEKKEKKERKERKEKKRREAEELAVKEKKISKKKHKSESKNPEKSEKSKKKSKKSEVEEEKPHKKSKEKKKKKHKESDESEEESPQSEIVRSDDSNPVTIPIITTTTTTTTTNTNDSDSDFEFDKEDIKHLLESYSKEDLINLIYKTAEKGSRLTSAVFESADRDTAQRNIFVRGLGWDTTHENLKAAFEIYGEIDECSVVMDKDTGRAKGYGFVMFKTRKGARKALRNPEKRMLNRNLSCNLAVDRPSGAGKPREPVFESVKIDLNQSEVVLPPGLDLAHGHGVDKGLQQQQQQNMAMYGVQNMPFYGLSQPPPGYNPMYGAFMNPQMVPGLPNYCMFGGPGMMNQGPVPPPVPPNHMGMAGQYVGEGNGGVGPGFDGERAWYLR